MSQIDAMICNSKWGHDKFISYVRIVLFTSPSVLDGWIRKMVGVVHARKCINRRNKNNEQKVVVCPVANG